MILDHTWSTAAKLGFSLYINLCYLELATVEDYG